MTLVKRQSVVVFNFFFKYEKHFSAEFFIQMCIAIASYLRLVAIYLFF